MPLTVIVALVFAVLMPQAAHDTVAPADLIKQLSGVWRADEDKTPRATALDTQIFGPGAFAVRNVTLTIQPSGDAKLAVSTAVVGRTGRRYAPSVIEATLKIGAPVSTFLGRPAPTVAIVNAEERYLDGGHERWPILDASSTVTVTDSTTLEFRLDTANGRNAFGTTLKRRR